MSALAGGHIPQSRPGSGSVGGPPVQSDYKRAVVKAAPRHFFAQVLPPTKVGGSYCYGLRVCPILSDNQSNTSNGSHREYDVWRRWEDCLWFQELLEYEYTLMARSKRDRLAAGKGIKKDDVYIHSDQAASFDSLPPGPEANSVALDIHEVVPKLSKKGTFFRASQATVEQRGLEFKAMIEGLLDENVPTLVNELREMRVIRDFFGIWRRDKDHDRKAAEADKKSINSRGSVRASITSSTLSMYFSSSNISLPGAHQDASSSPSRGGAASEASYTSPRSVRSLRTPVTAPVAFTVEDGALRSPVEEYPDPRGGLRSAPVRSPQRWSRASSALAPSECSSEGGSDVPIVFVSGEEHIPARIPVDRHTTLQALPEDEELLSSLSELSLTPSPPHPRHFSPVRRPRGNSAPERITYRNRFMFGGAPDVPDVVDHDAILTLDIDPRDRRIIHGPDVPLIMEIPKMSGPGSNSSKHSSVELSSFSDRSSWRTSAASITSIASNPSVGGSGSSSDVEKVLPDTPQTLQFNRQSYIPRDSMATVDSFIASSIMESMLPRRSISPHAPGGRRSFSVGGRQSRSTPPEEIPEEAWDERDDIMAAYFYDPSLRPVQEEVMENPEQHRTQSMVSTISTPERYPKAYQHRPPGQFHLPWNPHAQTIPEDTMIPSGSTSPTSAPVSPSESSIFPTTFTIKVVKEEAIVLLRADSTMSWLDIRNKVAEKFKTQEGIPLTKSFLIGYVPHTTPTAVQSSAAKTDRGRPRASSTSSVGLLQARGIRTIHSDEEWQQLIASSNGKLALRILDRF